MEAPDYYLIKIDERHYWSDQVKSRTAKIWGIYAFARNEYTYLCELTPSFCLMFLGTEHEPIGGLRDDQLEELHQDIDEGSAQSDPVTYMHVSSVERLISRTPGNIKKIDIEFDVDLCDTETEIWDRQFDQLQEGWSTGSLSF